MVLTTSQRQALKLLANAADGCTLPRMLGYGCSIVALRQLARCRLVITGRVRVPGNRRLTEVRLRISDAGRKHWRARTTVRTLVGFLRNWCCSCCLWLA
jgi:hypothetical protein